MAHLGQYYKMDDIDMRTYMGQPDPANDSFDAKPSELTFMSDKTRFHTGYSNANRECTLASSCVVNDAASCSRFVVGSKFRCWLEVNNV